MSNAVSLDLATPVSMPTTIDFFLEGSLMLEQPAPGFGYRVNEDSIALARFAAQTAREGSTIVDLGAGVGAVALVLDALVGPKRMILVEAQAILVSLASNNVRRAGAGERGQVIEEDVGLWSRRACGEHCAESFLVVANPPYTPPGAGRHATDPVRDAAKHGSLVPFVEAAGRLLTRVEDVACMCYPTSALVDYLVLAKQCGLRAKRMRFVHPRADRPARIALVELRGAVHRVSDGSVADTVADAVVIDAPMVGVSG